MKDIRETLKTVFTGIVIEDDYGLYNVHDENGDGGSLAACLGWIEGRKVRITVELI
jgi:hypothetical protein